MPAHVELPAGCTVRPATLADVDALTRLMAATSHAAVDEVDVTAAEVRDDLMRPTLDLPFGTWLVHGPDGRLVGYAEAEDEHPERANVEVYVDPAVPEPDRLAVAAWLLERCLARLDEIVTAAGRTQVAVDAGLYRDEEALAQVLRSGGLQPVRTYWRMALDLGDEHLAPPLPPPGVSIRALELDRTTEADLAYTTVEVSFRDHWDAVDEGPERFWERCRHGSAFDPTQWWVAEVDGEPAGVISGDNRRVHLNHGWVGLLGVLPAFRRRGVGQALLRHAFADHRTRGRTRTLLSVDSQSQTGATRLYESVGMAAVMTIDQYRGTAPRARR